MHRYVAPVGLQVDDGIPDNLPRAVIGDVAATACFADRDRARGQLVTGKDMTATAISAHAKRQHMGMFDDQQQVVHKAPLPFIHERALQGERIVIRHKAKPSDFDESRHLLIDGSVRRAAGRSLPPPSPAESERPKRPRGPSARSCA